MPSPKSGRIDKTLHSLRFIDDKMRPGTLTQLDKEKGSVNKS
jgi:hypothetical protein